MRLLASLAVAVLALSPVAVLAQPDSTVVAEAKSGEATAETAQAAAPKKVRKVCRSETATGSVMAKRKCYTVEQLKAQQKQTDQDLQNLKG